MSGSTGPVLKFDITAKQRNLLQDSFECLLSGQVSSDQPTQALQMKFSLSVSGKPTHCCPPVA